jgi:hypothetical protein
MAGSVASRARAIRAVLVLAATAAAVLSVAGPASASTGLPDGRAYEMVSPPQKNGALLGGFIFGPIPQIAEDGSRVLMGTLQCFGGAEACVAVRARTGSLSAFTRTTAGWTPSALTLPATQFSVNTFVLSSAETGAGVFSAPTPPDGEDHLYLRTSGGPVEDVGPVSPPAAGPNLNAVQNLGGAASADLARVLYETDPVWPESGEKFTTALFEYTGTGNSEPALVGASAGRDLISDCGTALGGEDGPGGSRGAVSDYGHIAYFTARACATGTGANLGASVPVNEVYARIEGEETGHPEVPGVRVAASTVAISEPRAPQVPPAQAEAQIDCTSASCQENTCDSPSCEENWRPAYFQQTSSDGSKAVFSSAQQLIDSATQDSNPEDTAAPCNEMTGPNGCNVYLFDFALPRGHRLLDVSAGAKPVVGGPRAQGVIAVSADGSHVYFVARGVLTDAANDRGQSAQEGAENLYVFARDATHPQGHVTFITTLPESDPATQEAIVSPHVRTANVTPDGRFLVFTSGGALTPDLTRVDGAQQVFRYDAQAGRLTRLSIGQNGYNENGNAGAGDAYIAPAWKGFARPGTGRADPTMSNDGEYVFFMSPVALAPGAAESVPIGVAEAHPAQYAENVYEYHDGTVSLISDGHDTAAGPAFACEPLVSTVCLIGSDATGANVFFTTTDELVKQDTDTELDLYDARICMGESPCLTAPAESQPCSTGEACQGTAPSAPSVPVPASVSLGATGNLLPLPPAKGKTPAQLRAARLAKALKACRKKHDRKERRLCERRARKRYGPVKAPAKAGDVRVAK